MKADLSDSWPWVFREEEEYESRSLRQLTVDVQRQRKLWRQFCYTLVMPSLRFGTARVFEGQRGGRRSRVSGNLTQKTPRQRKETGSRYCLAMHWILSPSDICGGKALIVCGSTSLRAVAVLFAGLTVLSGDESPCLVWLAFWHWLLPNSRCEMICTSHSVFLRWLHCMMSLYLFIFYLSGLCGQVVNALD